MLRCKDTHERFSHDFHWSIRLGNSNWFYVGVAARGPARGPVRGPQKPVHIGNYDKNSILFHTRDGVVFVGEDQIVCDFPRANIGDVIHFRFQPKLKKFCISLVRLQIHTNTSVSETAQIQNPEFRKVKKLLSISRILVIIRSYKAHLSLLQLMLICLMILDQSIMNPILE